MVLVLAGGLGAELSEPLPIASRDVVAGVEQLVQALDLGDSDRRLQVREAIVEPETVVIHLTIVLRRAALVAFARYPLRDLLVRRDEHASLAGRHLLVRVEGEDRDVPRCPDLAAHPIDRSESLGGVLQ